MSTTQVKTKKVEQVTLTKEAKQQFANYVSMYESKSYYRRMRFRLFQEAIYYDTAARRIVGVFVEDGKVCRLEETIYDK